MSTDFKLVNKDLSLGADHQLQLVSNTEKLAQDIGKVLNTNLGENTYNVQYGCNLRRMIGVSLPDPLLSPMVAAIVTEAVMYLQSLQQGQKAYQPVPDNEYIARMQNLVLTKFAPGRLGVSFDVVTTSGAAVTGTVL